jgi:hypothetical protein
VLEKGNMDESLEMGLKYFVSYTKGLEKVSRLEQSLSSKCDKAI